MTDLSRLDFDETVLVARIEDAACIAQGGKARFTPFLNERQQLLAQEVVRQKKLGGCMLWGGYQHAVRCVLGAFPLWIEPDAEQFPIEVVTTWLPKSAEVSHRDILGSLMGLRIGRECVGDILIDGQRCDIFIQAHLAGMVVDELRKVGRYSVNCETGVPGEYLTGCSFKEIRGTVRSARLDALVSILTGISREKSADLIRAERVQVNYQTAHRASMEFFPEDIITIRGNGKFIVDSIGAPTKKGRLPVLCSQYI